MQSVCRLFQSSRVMSGEELAASVGRVEWGEEGGWGGVKLPLIEVKGKCMMKVVLTLVAWLWATMALSSAHVQRRSLDARDALDHQNDFYLPRSVVPRSYRLQLVPDLDQGLFSGHVWVNVSCLEPVDSLTLHAHQNLNTTSAGLSLRRLPTTTSSSEDDDDGAKEMTVVSTKKNFAKQWYIIMLGEELQKGSDYELHVSFSGRLNDDSSEAFFRASYMDHRAQERSWYAATAMETTKARQVFPCWDEPALKATFQISVAARRKYHVLSNMPLMHTRDMEENPGWLWHHFPDTPLMSTFSVGVFVSDFHYATTMLPAGGFLRLSSRPELLENLEKINKLSAQTFNFAEEYLNFSYPLEKLDVIMLPVNSCDYSSDSWGLVMIRWSAPFGPASQLSRMVDSEEDGRTLLLSSPPSPQPLTEIIPLPDRDQDGPLTPSFTLPTLISQSLTRLRTGRTCSPAAPLPYPRTSTDLIPSESDMKDMAARTTAMAGSMLTQWLGHLTTPYWWSSISIHSALVSHLVSQFMTQKLNMTAGTTAYTLHQSHNSSKVQAPAITGHEYTDRVLLPRRHYKTFTEHNLWAALTSQGRQDQTLDEDVNVEEVAKSWLGKERYPVVTVTRNYEQNTATVEQRPRVGLCVLNAARIPARTAAQRPRQGADAVVHPVMYISADNLNISDMRPVAWLKKEKQVDVEDLPGEDKFVVVNPEEIGMFVVNYDVRNWGLLSEGLQEGVIPTQTRAKLLQDSWNLAYAGELDFSTALNLTLFLKDETTPQVWDRFFAMVDHLRRCLGATDLLPLFDDYARRLVDHCVRMLGESKADEDPSTCKLREAAKVFQYILSDQQHNASLDLEYRAWMENADPVQYAKNNEVPFEMILRWSPVEHYEFVLEYAIKLLDSGLVDEAKAVFIMLARSSTQQLERVDSLLNVLLLEDNANMVSSIPRACVSQLSEHYNGSLAIFHFVEDHWDALRERLESNLELWKLLMSAATARLITEEDLIMVSAKTKDEADRSRWPRAANLPLECKDGGNERTPRKPADQFHRPAWDPAGNGTRLAMFSEFYVEKRGHFGNAELLVEKELERMKEDAVWTRNNVPVIHQWLEDFLEKSMFPPGPHSAAEMAG
ncbi:hypothetical protein PR048_029590 [Dryococelus australis]|uniref:Uncharacterized protein n=1 Tax=Dryococelus australis TaxID=614101 RepID=A0ABQ9GFY6_9NEOP|nr:hypothetical protein PR048_029590 [Dryococelus australis]